MARLIKKTAVENMDVVEISVEGGLYLSKNGTVNHNCNECKRLHLLADEVTPRVWKLSQVVAGYHKKGDDKPSMSGEHPHCRCSLTYLPNGYGFDGSGKIHYIAPDHDEYTAQNG